MSSFLTIAKPTEGLYKEKGSKFLSFAFPVETVAEIEQILEFLKKEHAKSRHVCYAYILGADKSVYRANDAGEPNNSAGMPILNQIKSAGLTNILVVVVRYFGGTKLGLSGLISAYKAAAQNALEKAEIIEDFERENLKLQADYTKLTELLNFLKKNNVVVNTQDFSETCILHITFASENASVIKEALEKLPNVAIIE